MIDDKFNKSLLNRFNIFSFSSDRHKFLFLNNLVCLYYRFHQYIVLLGLSLLCICILIF